MAGKSSSDVATFDLIELKNIIKIEKLQNFRGGKSGTCCGDFFLYSERAAK